MRNLNLLNQYRFTDNPVMERYGTFGDHTCGAFTVPSPIDSQPLVVIASSGEGWDHVSVSRKNRVPNQTEMDFIFCLFFAEGERAVQFFVPRTEHVNLHPNCLHLWRPQRAEIPLPPAEFV